MPKYEYACKDCGEHVEVVQSFAEDPLTDCPKCGGPLRKVFGNIGVVFKGSGFYKTDSRSQAKRGRSENGAKGDKGDKGDKSDRSDKSDKSASKDDSKASSSGDKSSDKASTSSSDKSSSAATGKSEAKPAAKTA